MADRHARARGSERLNPRAAAGFRVGLAGMLAWAMWSAGLRPAWPVTTVPGGAWWVEHVVLTPGYAVVVAGSLGWFASGWRWGRWGTWALVGLLLPLACLTRGQQSRQVLLLVLLAWSLMPGVPDASSLPERRSSASAWGGGGWGWQWDVILLIRVQLCLVYLVNVWAKLSFEFLTGEVLVGLSKMRPNFLVDLSEGHVRLPEVGWITIPEVPVWVAGVGTVLVELFIPIALWFRGWRWVAAGVGVMFHAVLILTVNIWMLDWVSFVFVSGVLAAVARDGFRCDTRRFVADSSASAWGGGG